MYISGGHTSIELQKCGLRAVLQKQRPLGRPDGPPADEQRSCSQAYICLRKYDLSKNTMYQAYIR